MVVVCAKGPCGNYQDKGCVILSEAKNLSVSIEPRSFASLRMTIRALRRIAIVHLVARDYHSNREEAPVLEESTNVAPLDN